MNKFDELLLLSGAEREQRWLRERLETLSVREGIALTAAIQRTRLENAADAINCLLSLEDYMVRIDAGSYEDLGRAYIINDTVMPNTALPFMDLEQTGRYYEDQHPGLFVGDCYVKYPEKELQPVYRGQDAPLPEDSGWSVKLRIASDAVPEGVWLRMPYCNSYGDDSSVDEELVLRELKAQDWSECALLDARCILPQVCDFKEYFDNIKDLINCGQVLDWLLYVYGRDLPDFMERCTAVLELENCRSLPLAMDITENLKCYDWIARTDLEESARKSLLDLGVTEELIRTSGLDLAAYEAHLLEEDGYTPLSDGSYIRRNCEEFHYYYYHTPAPEQSGMSMQ